MMVVRSPYAHATITRIQLDAARAHPGVIAGYTRAELVSGMPALATIPVVGLRKSERRPLAIGCARCVGDPVAVLLAESLVVAEDARDLVEVDYEPLPVVTDPERALEPDAPLLYAELGSNVAFRQESGGGDMAAAFARADHIVRLRLVNQRLAPSSLEPHACFFDFDEKGASAMQMRAMVLEAFGGTLKAEIRPVPERGPGEVLVRVVACGAGLTLESIRLGHLGGSTPRIMGHEYSGTVAALGAGVAGWQEGEPVTGSFYLFCGNCVMCASGRETLCLNNQGNIGAKIDGAFAEYIVVPARNLVRIPTGVALREAGVIADAVATPYHIARERARIVAGQRVAVIGAGGGVGIHMLQVAKAFGAFVIAVERDATKLRRLPEVAPNVLVDASAESWSADLIQAAEGQLDVCIDFVGSPETTSRGLAALGRGGTFVIAGAMPGLRSDNTAVISAAPMYLVNKEISIVGTRYATRAEIARSLELVRDGKVRPVIGASFPLERAEEALDAIRRNQVFGRVLIDCAG
jgi:propanol-preferring alcohol dehydrogenase